MTHCEPHSRARQDGQASHRLPGRELERSEDERAARRANLLGKLSVQEEQEPPGCRGSSSLTRWRRPGLAKTNMFSASSTGFSGDPLFQMEAANQGPCGSQPWINGTSHLAGQGSAFSQTYCPLVRSTR